MEPGVCQSILSLFDSCPNPVQEEILKHSVRLSYSADTRFVEEGATPKGIFVVCSGGLKLTSHRGEREQIVLLKGPGDVVGIENWLQQQAYSFSVTTVDETCACFIPGEYVNKAIHASPSVFFNIMKNVNARAEDMEARSTLLMTDNSEKVVMTTMQELRDKFGTDAEGYIRLNLPVKDLANYICMSKTNLYRVLNNLRERYVLLYDENRYKLMRG